MLCQQTEDRAPTAVCSNPVKSHILTHLNFMIKGMGDYTCEDQAVSAVSRVLSMCKHLMLIAMCFIVLNFRRWLNFERVPQ